MQRPKFTTVGQDLQLKASAGVADLVFTKIKLGDGVLGDTDFKTLSDIVSPKITLPLTGIKVNDGYATIKAVFNNQSIVDGFQYREIGLYAKNPENPSTDILYCYANFEDEGGYIAEPTSKLIEKLITIVAIIDDAQNVSAILDGSAVYIDVEELNEAIEIHNMDPNAHPDLFKLLSAHFYIDPETVEDAELRTGEQAHPFANLKEAYDALPKFVTNITFELLKGGVNYVSEGITFRSFNSVTIKATDGLERNPPKLATGISFFDCNYVELNTFEILNTVVPIFMQGCGNFYIMGIQSYSLQGKSFFNVNNSRGNIAGCYISNADTGVSALASNILIGYTTISGNTGIRNDNSVITVASNNVITATTPFVTYTGGAVIDAETGQVLTNGSVKNHIIDTNNPHLTTLSQVVKENDVLGIANGGTGLTTGATFTPNQGYNCRGSITLPGGLLLQWGRLSCDSSNTSVYFNQPFANESYVLTFTTSSDSGFMPDWRVPDKSTDHFTMRRATSTGTQVADWIAIGQRG